MLICLPFLWFPLPFKVEDLRGVWFWKLAEDCKIVALRHFFHVHDPVRAHAQFWNVTWKAWQLLTIHNMALAGKGNEKIWPQGSLTNVIIYIVVQLLADFLISVKKKKVPLTNYSMYIFHAFLIPCMILSAKSLQIMPLKSRRSHINLELEMLLLDGLRLGKSNSVNLILEANVLIVLDSVTIQETWHQ